MERPERDAEVMMQLCTDLDRVTAALHYLVRLARYGDMRRPRLIPPYRDNHLGPLPPLEALYRTEAFRQFEQRCTEVGLANTLREERWTCYGCAQGDVAGCVPKMVEVALHSLQPPLEPHYMREPGTPALHVPLGLVRIIQTGLAIFLSRFHLPPQVCFLLTQVYAALAELPRPPQVGVDLRLVLGPHSDPFTEQHVLGFSLDETMFELYSEDESEDERTEQQRFSREGEIDFLWTTAGPVRMHGDPGHWRRVVELAAANQPPILGGSLTLHIVNDIAGIDETIVVYPAADLA
jgi:hypothetical protein